MSRVFPSPRFRPSERFIHLAHVRCPRPRCHDLPVEHAQVDAPASTSAAVAAAVGGKRPGPPGARNAGVAPGPVRPAAEFFRTHVPPGTASRGRACVKLPSAHAQAGPGSDRPPIVIAAHRRRRLPASDVLRRRPSAESHFEPPGRRRPPRCPGSSGPTPPANRAFENLRTPTSPSRRPASSRNQFAFGNRQGPSRNSHRPARAALVHSLRGTASVNRFRSRASRRPAGQQDLIHIATSRSSPECAPPKTENASLIE